MRFALLEMKMALYAIFKKYELVPCDESPRKVTMDPKSAFGSSKEPLYFKARLRST